MKVFQKQNGKYGHGGCIGMEALRSQEKDNIDRCVVCGIKTEYTKDTPISERFGYIIGGGQLCRKCYTELYGNGPKSRFVFLSEE